MYREKIRSIAASFLISILTLFPLSQRNFSFQFASAADADLWQDYENYIVIAHDTVWHGTITRADIPKPVVVVDGATLTIEKGTHIELGLLSVFDGKIIANGTEKEKIIFTKQPIDLSSFPPGYEKYDINCFISMGGMIEFSDSAEATDTPSIFRYVEFDGMGTYIQYEDENCMPMVMRNKQKSLFFNTAYAASRTVYNPALKFVSGKLHIENTLFKNNVGSDIEASLWFSDEWESYDSLQVINSSFEGNTQNTALISSISYTGAPKDYSSHVLLKNNWYGDVLGPKVAPEYFMGGEKLIGEYMLTGVRSKALIADPVIVIPGITGSAKVFGKWTLDPITHIYDDLILSLEQNGYEKDINLFEFPYDWHSTNEVSARALQSLVENIRNTTDVSQVDIIAHSMGGLIARAYIEEVGGALYTDVVDKLITLGTPNDGSPEAYLKWEAGEGFFTVKESLGRHHFLQEAEKAGYTDLHKYINERVVSVGELLPDKDYLFDVSSRFLRNYFDGYPRNTFLEELNTDQNKEKLTKVDYANIVGITSLDKTISRIRVVESSVPDKWVNGMPENFYNVETNRGLEYGAGDETVPESSAKGVTANKVIEMSSSHNELPTKAQCEVFRELTGMTECNYVELWRVPNILLFNLFSPVDVQIVSPSGLRVGKNFDTGEILNEIKGAYYTGYDTPNEFVTIPNPEKGEYRILTQGTGTGNYRVEAVSIQEDASGKATESIVTINGTAEVNKNDESVVEVKETGDVVIPTTTGTISGMKFDDRNRNGKKDTNELGLQGWTIRLKNGNNVVTAVTGADGTYSFTNLDPGTYKVREIHQNGWKRMSKNPKPIVLVAGANVIDVNFGNVQKRRGEREDTNQDDEQSDESGNYYTNHTNNDYDHDLSSKAHKTDHDRNDRNQAIIKSKP